MDYSDFTREQLLERIKELEIFNHELLLEKEQEVKLEYAWTGNLGHWYWSVKTNTVTFNPLKVTALGYDKSEIPEHVTYEFFTDKLHPEDYQKTMDAMLDHLQGRANIYEIEYRIQTKDGKYKWFYDRGKITQYDDLGKPLFLTGIVFDITEKKEKEMKLEHNNKILVKAVTLDGLTKISNHKTLIEHLKSEIADAMQTKKPLSVAMFDLDNFKRVNDTKGHVFGDQVLIDIATIIQKGVRDADLAGRYGGEEFMVIFPNSDLKNAVNIAERIRKVVEDVILADGIKITISGGVKQYRGESLVDLIHYTDMNLYEAKRKGKNQIVY